MATKLPTLLPFLLLLAFQEMMVMRADAATCQAESRLFTGLCFSSKNCGAICGREGFLNGKCELLKCVCLKDCQVGGGGGGTPRQGPPSGEAPPEEGPPGGEAPPGEDPPTGEEPPVEGHDGPSDKVSQAGAAPLGGKRPPFNYRRLLT